MPEPRPPEPALARPGPQETGEGEPGDAAPLFELVRRRYGSRLTEVELAALRQAVEAIVEQGRALGAVRLRNADEPFVVFRPDPWP